MLEGGFKYMRLTAFGAGVLLSIVILSVNTGNASAETISVASLKASTSVSDKLAVLEIVEEQASPQAPVATVPPTPVKHVVVEGENLSKIATQHQTTWKRLYDKNTHVADPDVVNAGTELTVPLPDEQLSARELPVDPAPVVQAPASRSTTAKSKPAQVASYSRGSSAGNTYAPGYCTWYVKNRRPDLPNNLGNAYTWVTRAASQGIPTGSEPRVGAVGQRGNHVVYVEAVNGDGTVTISEMNYRGLYETNTRTVPASYFQYIY